MNISGLLDLVSGKALERKLDLLLELQAKSDKRITDFIHEMDEFATAVVGSLQVLKAQGEELMSRASEVNAKVDANAEILTALGTTVGLLTKDVQYAITILEAASNGMSGDEVSALIAKLTAGGEKAQAVLDEANAAEAVITPPVVEPPPPTA